MDFDLLAMKRRAMELMKATRPSSIIVGVIYAAFAVLSVIVTGSLLSSTDGIKPIAWIILLLIKVVDVNLKTSIQWYCLKITREMETTINEIFSSFSQKFLTVSLQGLIRDILAGIGYMFCVVGAILPIYWFRFSGYALRDDDSLGVVGSLKKSMKLTKGHFSELFKLDLSNIGWYFLMIVTCGLANVYVKPYLTLVYAEYYDYLKAQDELFGN